MYDYIDLAGASLKGGAIISSSFSFIGAILSFSFGIEKEKITASEMAEMGMLVALAVVLDVVSHYVIPKIPSQVGSISIALLPLYFLSLRHGAAKGLLASSFAFGLITCLTDGYGLWTYPLDYLVAFSGVAIIGLFKEQIIGEDVTKVNIKGELLILCSILLAGLVRLVGSGASSILNYKYTFIAAVEVNILYSFVSAIICAVILMAFYGPIIKINKRFPLNSRLGE